VIRARLDKESVMADLSTVLDRTLALATVVAPMVLLVGLLCVAAARAYAEPGPSLREKETAPRWRLDR
jgi:hypothetical protein